MKLAHYGKLVKNTCNKSRENWQGV